MAYGDENTKLENFDRIIPENVFQEVTSITTDQFRFLRDGGDYVDEETGGTEQFDGHLFDPVVFDENLREDIFDYVPPQKTNQIFTPRRVVVQMVDMLEQENPVCFDDPTRTFADLYMKSGLYITEIIKRLYRNEGMRDTYPDDRERLDHILEHQAYGIAPTEIIYQIATHYILGCDDEVGNGCKTHFVKADSAELAKNGKLSEYVEQVFGDNLND